MSSLMQNCESSISEFIGEIVEKPLQVGRF